MEALLDLLFSNLLVVAAVIGGIYSFFRSMNKGEQEAPPSPPSGPTIKPAEVAKSENSPSQNETSFQQHTSRDYMDEVKVETSMPPVRKRASTTAPESKDGNGRTISRKQLAEGMIMSEILGPPRAHRPHKALRNYRR